MLPLAFQHPSPVARTMMKVEVKRKLEDNYEEGKRASNALIKADKEIGGVESNKAPDLRQFTSELIEVNCLKSGARELQTP